MPHRRTAIPPIDPHLVEIAPEVRDALHRGRPVVALESTIVTHGMPFPENVETAVSVEAVVRDRGAVPATIALLDGRIRIGLDAATLRRLGQARPVEKASRRDLAAVLAARMPAGTTVSATMLIAHRVGIAVFATGGIGGVHRGAESSFDISADLDELGRTPVAVVCAGAKAILDIPKTLELLETRGVPVIGYRTDDFPAFFARSSGVPVPRRMDRAADIAALIDIQHRLGLEAGILVANPIPVEDALSAAVMERAIREAVAEADSAGIRGKDVTPFLLARLVDITEGRSLQANIALIRDNAGLAADIAGALSDQRRAAA